MCLDTCFVIQHRAKGNFLSRLGGVVGMTFFGWLSVRYFVPIVMTVTSLLCGRWDKVVMLVIWAQLQVMLLAVRCFIFDVYIR